MTIALAVMVWFAMEKRRRKHFERFWYSHHLFIIFFAMWQLHVSHGGAEDFLTPTNAT